MDVSAYWLCPRTGLIDLDNNLFGRILLGRNSSPQNVRIRQNQIVLQT